MKCDADRLAKLSSEIKKALVQLDRLAQVPEAEFMADADKTASAKYHFLLAIQAAIDICLHLISMNGLEAPTDYADAFRVVGKAGAFTEEYTAKLQQAARFRNRLVHLYWMIDDRELARILRDNLADLEGFLPAVGKVCFPGA